MKTTISLIFFALFSFVFSCKQFDQANTSSASSIPASITAKLKAAGFVTDKGLSRYENGYLVEFDIFMTEADINSLALNTVSPASAKGGRTEHYHTTNLANPGTIKVYMDPSFDQGIQDALVDALARYNAVQMPISFIQVTDGGGDITILAQPSGDNNILALSQFPSSTGHPGTPIKINTFYFNDAAGREDNVSVIAHEIGHAIGLRHTDYADVSYSCLYGSGTESDNGGVGAVHIPGTSTGGSPGSFMLACTDGTDRPFTTDDVTALRNLYTADVNYTGHTITIVNSVDADAWTINSIYYSLDGGTNWTLLVGNSLKLIEGDLVPIWKANLSNNCSNNALGNFGYQLASQSAVYTQSSYAVGGSGLTITTPNYINSSDYTVTFIGHAIPTYSVSIVNNLNSLNPNTWSLTSVSYSIDGGTTWCLIPGTTKTFSVKGTIMYKFTIKNITGATLPGSFAVQVPHQALYTPCTSGCSVASGATYTITTPNVAFSSGNVTIYESPNP